MTNTNRPFTIDSDASYAAFLRESTLSPIAHQFAIVSGKAAAEMLRSSSHPELLEFTLLS